MAGICSATAQKSNCRYGLKEDLQRHQLPSLFEAACSLSPRFPVSVPTCYTPPSEHLPPPLPASFWLQSLLLPPTVPERPGRQTCAGASFQNQLVHRMPFWHLYLVMCLQGYSLLGNCQLKFEPDLGLQWFALGDLYPHLGTWLCNPVNRKLRRYFSMCLYVKRYWFVKSSPLTGTRMSVHTMFVSMMKMAISSHLLVFIPWALLILKTYDMSGTKHHSLVFRQLNVLLSVSFSLFLGNYRPFWESYGSSRSSPQKKCR